MDSRVKFETVRCDIDTLVTRAHVRMSRGMEQRTGMATGLTATASPLQVAAEATIDAIQGFVGPLEVTVDSITEIVSGKRPLIVITLNLRDGQEELLLAGTAIRNGDPYVAVGKAVLHGLNRRISLKLQ